MDRHRVTSERAVSPPPRVRAESRPYRTASNQTTEPGEMGSTETGCTGVSTERKTGGSGSLWKEGLAYHPGREKPAPHAPTSNIQLIFMALTFDMRCSLHLETAPVWRSN